MYECIITLLLIFTIVDVTIMPTTICLHVIMFRCVRIYIYTCTYVCIYIYTGTDVIR